MTATASSCVSKPTKSPTSTRPVTSLGLSILVGRTEVSIKSAGDIELPPESELREPTKLNSDPSAPALYMPYIGLCGLLPVSFSERAGITTPLIFARVSGDVFSSMPLKKALSE